MTEESEKENMTEDNNYEEHVERKVENDMKTISDTENKCRKMWTIKSKVKAGKKGEK